MLEFAGNPVFARKKKNKIIMIGLEKKAVIEQANKKNQE
jgi:hypothetical protein